jgi:hypothetical protein
MAEVITELPQVAIGRLVSTTINEVDSINADRSSTGEQ